MHVVSQCFNAVANHTAELAAISRVDMVSRAEGCSIHALNKEENNPPIAQADLFLEFLQMLKKGSDLLLAHFRAERRRLSLTA